MATTALHPAVPAYRSGLYEWITTTDHKKIGILYVVNSLLFFFIAGLLAWRPCRTGAAQGPVLRA